MSDSQQLNEAIVTALRRIIRAVDLHSRDLLQSYGLTSPQLLTLQELARLQPVPVGVLSGAVHVSQATMTGILDRLEQRQLVVRTRDGGDRRSVTITMTPEGGRILKKAPSLLQVHFIEELARLKPSEQTNMLHVLQRIAQMMGAADLAAVPMLVSGPEPLGVNGDKAAKGASGRRVAKTARPVKKKAARRQV